MKSYRFKSNVMCDGAIYSKGCVYELTEQDALAFGDQIELISSNVSQPVKGDSSDDKLESVAEVHPNKAVKRRRVTKK